jgi:deoxycytidylate deaminase
MVHAEGNALRYIRPGEGRLLAVTLFPCIECLKMAKSYDINTIVYSSMIMGAAYDVGAIQKMAFEFGVTLKKVNPGYGW